MKIPEQFTIFGQTIKVVWDKHLIFNEDTVGEAQYRLSQIALQKSTPEYPRSRQLIEQTYLHEVVHVILEQLKYDKLRSDEEFVDRVASALHQVLTTSKGDLMSKLKDNK